MAETTTIRVSEATWQRLHDLKRPGVSFDDIIEELLDNADDTEEPKTATAGGGGPNA